MRPSDRGSQRLTFVDIARGGGALLVCYTHLQTDWLREGDSLLASLSDAVFGFVLDPLYLSADGLGQVAVVLFFLTSGYVVTPIALRLGSARFGVNRLFRIYPLLVASVLLAAVAVWVGVDVLGEPGPEVTPSRLLTNALLVNFFLDGESVLLGITWTLLVEVLFYLTLIALLPILRRAMWLAIAVELTLLEVAISLHGPLDGYHAEFATSAAVLVLPIVGQVFWAAQRRTLPVAVAGLYLLLGWLLFVWAAGLEVSSFDDGYPVAVGLGIVLFLIGLLAEPRLTPRRVWTILSDRCYSIYLLHGVVAFAVLDAAMPMLGVVPAVILALVVTAAAVEIVHRCIERPSHQLGRRLSRARPPGTDPLPEADAAVPLPCSRAGAGGATADRGP